jgi:hypothetical protein
MRLIREWFFPVALIVSWVVFTGYTLSLMSRMPTASSAAVHA